MNLCTESSKYDQAIQLDSPLIEVNNVPPFGVEPISFLLGLMIALISMQRFSPWDNKSGCLQCVRIVLWLGMVPLRNVLTSPKTTFCKDFEKMGLLDNILG